MDQITAIGIDLAKTIFQDHAFNGSGKGLLQKAVKRAALPPLLAQLSACLMDLAGCSALRRHDTDFTYRVAAMRFPPGIAVNYGAMIHIA